VTLTTEPPSHAVLILRVQVTCKWMLRWRIERVTRLIQFASCVTSLATLCRDIAGTRTASLSTLPLDHVPSLMVIASSSRQRLGDPGNSVKLMPNTVCVHKTAWNSKTAVSLSCTVRHKICQSDLHKIQVPYVILQFSK